ncbi:L-threonylcarbamoyladenylate synthase [Convivina intestini]|uniref:Threonylcarbamoyl-AMP synthase n=1 Tax=Convivina intestini TaxID=1505726 RepID=A0A2U1DBQ7_9LACO|nr:L-threonylcarbamoyladenylate synthase [Convivina intestini]PVY85029.1 translation factor SUA5 [Convivina intestini]SDB89241.1 L-threonylcarbamoyladenylate synthase [Leuconostocaceae bacterium R-53105]
METKKFTTLPADLQAAAQLIQQGQVVAFPTETVYGLGANALDETAVQKVFTAKGRPADNPLIITVDQIDQVADLAVISPTARQLMDQFWPGSLTIILPIQIGKVSPLVTGGLDTAAFRLPDNQATQELIRLAGTPIVGPSANTSGKPSPTTAAHVWHDMQGKIAGIVDDGPTTVGVESTVIDLSTSQPTILRTGAVTQEELSQALGQSVIDATSAKAIADNQTPKAPGMKYRHYAPDKPVVVFDPLDIAELKLALKPADVVLALEEELDILALPGQQTWSLGSSIMNASEQLFAGLRYFDDRDSVQTIYVERMPEMGLGRAFNNRLSKAAGNQFFIPKEG